MLTIFVLATIKIIIKGSSSNLFSIGIIEITLNLCTLSLSGKDISKFIILYQ